MAQGEKKKKGHMANFGMSYENWNQQKKVEIKIKNILIEEEEKILRKNLQEKKLHVKNLHGEKAYNQWLAKKEIEDKIKNDRKREDRFRKKFENEELKNTSKEVFNLWLQKQVLKDHEKLIVETEKREEERKNK
eukprot:CAMPEP_0205807110 /NCGR_PEP_ID=MMETSP0205-20121125/10795_1 /ASSEMBLY_ACC=CAM_ASM_000278 /TAXON_ID=36767 /ORGANISM="Euplotes focardii, Strain TN1" /LENGTH=133 /DNA_ID=CAMNT_0053080923 /DNA_START=266 /DNA_END=667 /DNA_ORIENTATION=+